MLLDTSVYREFYNADEEEQWAEIHYPDVYGDQRLVNPDFEILTYYSGSAYKLYSRVFRYGWEYSDDTMREAMQLMNILGKRKLPESVVAYRYTHKRDMKLLCSGQKMRPGLRFADKGFFSTSLVKSSLDKFKKKYGCDCLLKLYLPKGIYGTYISLKGTASILGEQELLLQRNTEFEIIKIHRFCCPMIIECKAIINPTSEV
jgi:hypothetical protein